MLLVSASSPLILTDMSTINDSALALLLEETASGCVASWQQHWSTRLCTDDWEQQHRVHRTQKRCTPRHGRAFMTPTSGFPAMLIYAMGQHATTAQREERAKSKRNIQYVGFKPPTTELSENGRPPHLNALVCESARHGLQHVGAEDPVRIDGREYPTVRKECVCIANWTCLTASPV